MKRYMSIVIFNRWGKQVLHTKDTMINWDRRNILTKTTCAADVYLYTGEVYFVSTEGLKKRHLQGAVTLIR